jgi:hypothetical protein
MLFATTVASIAALPIPRGGIITEERCFTNVDDARAKCLTGVLGPLDHHPRECYLKADMINRDCVNRFPNSDARRIRLEGQRCFQKVRSNCHRYCDNQVPQCVDDQRECEEKRELKWKKYLQCVDDQRECEEKRELKWYQCIKDSPCHKKLLKQKRKHTSYLSQMGETEFFLDFVIPLCIVPEKNKAS